MSTADLKTIANLAESILSGTLWEGEYRWPLSDPTSIPDLKTPGAPASNASSPIAL